MKEHIIYIAINCINGKIYVGKTEQQLGKRKSRHFHNATVGKYDRSSFYLAINKYGKENFLFCKIEKCCIDTIDDKEKYWIKLLDTTNKKFGYNIHKGGTGGFVGLHSKEAKRKIGEASRKHWNNEEYREKMAKRDMSKVSEKRKIFYEKNPDKKIKGNKCYNWIDVDLNQIKEMYLSGMNMRQIGIKLNLSKGVVERRLKLLNLYKPTR